MLAVVKHKPEPGIAIRSIREPRIEKAGDVLIEVRAAGICGSDVYIYDWTFKYRYPIRTPVVLGHEFCGVIVETGTGVDGLQVGDRVSAESIIGCNKCYMCRSGFKNRCQQWTHVGIDIDGGFARYVVVPAQIVHKLSDKISDEDGAFLEPIAIATRAVMNTCIHPGDRIAVLGPGPFGLFLFQAAKAAGAGLTMITGLGIDTERLSIAKKIGADVVINIEKENPIKKIKELTDGVGPDVIIQAAENPLAVTQAIEMVRPGGQVILAGSPSEPSSIPSIRIVRDEITIGGVEAALWEDYERALRLIADGKIKGAPLITHRIQLKEAEKGFELMKQKRAVKVLFIPPFP